MFNVYMSNKILELPLSFFTKYDVKKIIKTYKIDLIHQYTQSSVGNYCLDISKKFNIPFIYSFRGISEAGMLATINMRRLSNKKNIKFMYNKLKEEETEILKNSNFITTLSEPMKNVLVKRGIDENKILIIPNSIDHTLLTKRYEKDLKEKNLLNDCYVIGHFGHLREYEGIEILLKSLRIILNCGMKVKLLLIGSFVPRYVVYLKNIIKNENLEKNVIFIGRIPHNEIGKYYYIVDMIVIPRLDTYECRIVTPLKPIDAMAFKTLVVASDLPALRYTINPYETGILFKPSDPLDLSNKILECINNPIMCQKIVEKAYNNVLKNFTWESVVPKYEEVYKKLIKK